METNKPYYKMSVHEKGEYITKYPVRAGLIRTLQALIPAILVGIAIVVLSQGFHNAWHWTIHHSSAIAQFVRYGIPAITAGSMIITGSIAHIKHYKNYVRQYERLKKNNKPNGANEWETDKRNVAEKLEKNEKRMISNDLNKGGIEIKNTFNSIQKDRISCKVQYGGNSPLEIPLLKEDRVSYLKEVIALRFDLINAEGYLPTMCLAFENGNAFKIIKNEKNIDHYFEGQKEISVILQFENSEKCKIINT